MSLTWQAFSVCSETKDLATSGRLLSNFRERMASFVTAVSKGYARKSQSSTVAGKVDRASLASKTSRTYFKGWKQNRKRRFGRIAIPNESSSEAKSVEHRSDPIDSQGAYRPQELAWIIWLQGGSTGRGYPLKLWQHVPPVRRKRNGRIGIGRSIASSLCVMSTIKRNAPRREARGSRSYRRFKGMVIHYLPLALWWSIGNFYFLGVALKPCMLPFLSVTTPTTTPSSLMPNAKVS